MDYEPVRPMMESFAGNKHNHTIDEIEGPPELFANRKLLAESQVIRGSSQTRDSHVRPTIMNRRVQN